MAQQLSALICRFGSCTHMAAHNSLTPDQGDLTYFWPPRAPSKHMYADLHGSKASIHITIKN